MGKKKRVAPKLFVLDASVALAWFFQDEADPYADAVAAEFPKAQAVVSAIWHLEIANALVMGERRGRSTLAQATAWTTDMASLPITIDDQTQAQAWGDTSNLARAHNLSAYDASYLELALRRNLPISTLDDRLRTAATAVGVEIFEP